MALQAPHDGSKGAPLEALEALEALIKKIDYFSVALFSSIKTIVFGMVPNLGSTCGR